MKVIFLSVLLFLAGRASVYAQDLAPERIANMVISLGAGSVPILPIPYLYSEDGYIYNFSDFDSNTVLSSFGSRFSWIKTGRNSGTLIRTTGLGRSETHLTLTSYHPEFGWFGNYRQGSIAGFVTIVPFSPLSQAPLRNTSTRVSLATGGMATMGFVVGGATPRRVLVRAIGPSLAQFGVANPAATLALTVLQSGSEIGANSGWGGAADVASVFSKVGAFGLPTSSRDCALVLTLAAGNYTAQVRADGGGDVLFEVYFVD
jgi:hypothetical protein